jgi:hypothetical protein
MPSDQPYLSVVVTGRNDDHGANFLRRLQAFVNALLGQAKRHTLSIELILVDWNPPAGKPPLGEVLYWPADTAPCRVRAITVPEEVHRRYGHAEAMPLYQMIAKNVGIRRAEGEYILATNIDILFSDELMQFFGERRLETGRMYRIDRHDVAPDVPVDGSVEDRLAYCRDHLLRVNARDGTFPLSSDGHHTSFTIDIARREAGIVFGAGWSPPEQYFGQLFRMAGFEAELGVQPAAEPRVLLIELEAAPPTACLPVTVFDSSGASVGEVRIGGRAIVRIGMAAHAATIRFRTGSETASVRAGLRVFRCEWDRPPRAEGPLVRAESAPPRPVARAWQTVRSAAGFVSAVCRGESNGRIGLPLSTGTLERFRRERSGASFAFRKAADGYTISELPPYPLHTNACGDFTLAHRRHWMELRGYPEFDLYSMNLDAVFCYMAHFGGAPEHVLADPMRIYHIEHSAGSGWTPEGQEALYRRLADKGIPWLPYEVVEHWASQMKSLGTTMVFNREDWGLGGVDLRESSPTAPLV